MDKKSFNKELNKKISHLPEEEIKRILDFYEEQYNEKHEQGLREDFIIKSFGSPDDIVLELTQDSVFNNVVKKAKVKAHILMSPLRVLGRLFKNKSFLIFYFSAFIFTIPLTLMLLGGVILVVGLLIGAIALVLGLLVGAIIMVAAFGLAGILGGPALVVTGFINISNGFGIAGLGQLGAAFMFFGLGIALLPFAISLLRYLRILVFVKKARRREKYQAIKLGRKLRITLCLLSLIIFLIGSVMFVIAYGQTGWSNDFFDYFSWPLIFEK